MVTMRDTAQGTSRYEQIMLDHSARPGDAASLLNEASRDARAAVPAATEHEQAIRDVAAGVAPPPRGGAGIWLVPAGPPRGRARLRVLTRGGRRVRRERGAAGGRGAGKLPGPHDRFR